jgi:dTMP kinase
MFITFEGPDGSGKTTQSKLIFEYLKGQGKDVVWTREPGDSSIGQKIRELLLEDEQVRLDKHTELLLFCADRAQHVAEVIKPALAAGKIVVCDRYIDSTSAYQSGGRGFSEKMIEQLNEYSTNGLKPDLTILIDIPSDIGLGRATKETADKFEKEALEFHRKVRDKYLEIAKNEGRFKVFDGTETIENLLEKIKKVIL